MKALIGIISNMNWETQGVWAGYKKSYVNFDYSKAVERAGGIPLLIPLTDDNNLLEETVSALDGIIITGGQDVNPMEFNEEPHEKLGQTLYERDKTDIAVIKKALELKVPLLGICRGHQIINLILGGSLYQDLSQIKEGTIQHLQGGFPNTLSHTIEIKEGSLLKEIFKENNKVNSYHHQVIDKLGEGLEVTARSKDNIIEAIEKINDKEFILGVQFHPEMLANRYSYHQEIFNRFVDECDKRKKK